MKSKLSKLYALLFVLLGFAYASCGEFPFDGLGDADPDLTDTIFDEPEDSVWIDDGDTTDIGGWPDDSTDIDWPDDTLDGGWPEDTIVWPGDTLVEEDSIP